MALRVFLAEIRQTELEAKVFTHALHKSRNRAITLRGKGDVFIVMSDGGGYHFHVTTTSNFLTFKANEFERRIKFEIFFFEDLEYILAGDFLAAGYRQLSVRLC